MSPRSHLTARSATLGSTHNANHTIGLNLSEDIEENINIKTKRLGKKQITWFKKEHRLKMINSENPDDVYKYIMEIINE